LEVVEVQQTTLFVRQLADRPADALGKLMPL
jgi:hypothetical protein